MSVLKSAPGALTIGSKEPASTTSITGHGFGLRKQNIKNSRASLAGNITKLACTLPKCKPPVLRTNLPLRID